MENLKRYPMLDFLRGIAVILMIFFHFHYDLNYFGLVTIDFFENRFWWTLPRFIVFLFLLCVGMGLFISHGKDIHWKKFFLRFLLIAGCALLISLVTYWLFPESWIYFGTLHCIAASSLVGISLVKYPKISLAAAFLILLSAAFFPLSPFFPWPTHKSLDYIPLYPWVAVVFFGIFVGSTHFHRRPLPPGTVWNLLCWPGKHSLTIYLLHQPLLFSFCYFLARFMRSAP